MKNSFALKYIFFSFIILTLTIPAFADVKIKSKQTVSGQTSESAIYIKGKRQRTETNVGGTEAGANISVMECDLRRTIKILPAAQAYTIERFADTNNSAATETVVDQKTTTTVTKGGMITTTVTSKDTGERKQMFGYTARHIITTIETVSSPDACTPVNSRMQQDGWYIDAAFALSCSQNNYANYVPKIQGGCQDKVQVKQVGAPKTGFALLEKMTMFDTATGKETFSMQNEVVELSQATLSDALFDVPADYKEFKDSAQMYAAMKTKMSSAANLPNGVLGGGNPQSETNSGLSANVKNLNNKTSDASTNVGEKKPGVIRIGLAQVKSGAVGEGMNGAELAAAIGNSLAEYLKAPNVEVVRLEARLPSQIDLEAKNKSCDYVIYAQVSHKKGGGGFGSMFSKAAGGMLGNMIPMAGGVGGAIAGSVVSTAVVTAANASANVKPKDEITLEYKLVAPGANAPAVADTLKAKAKSDGEDIISPLIEQAAQSIVSAIAKK